MSRILKLFYKSNFNLFLFNSGFYKNNFFLKKKSYFYFDYFFYLISIKNNYNYISFLNLKNFFNFFENYLNNFNKFIILDYNQYYTTFFNNLLFSNIDLIKYNNFFKFNLKLLKFQHFYYLFNFFLKKFNINMIVVLDYKTYHLYFPYFNNLGVCLFSFLNLPQKFTYLDYFYFSNFNYIGLEKIFFLSKLLQLYNFYFFKNLQKYFKQ